MALETIAVSYAFPPLPFPRSIQVARLLKHLDMGMLLICGAAQGKLDATIPSLGPDSPVKIHRILYREPPLAPILRRLLQPDPYLGWSRSVGRWFLRSEALSEARTLITFGHPMSDHLVGVAAKRHRPKIRWISHFSDPWARSPFRTTLNLARRVNERLERQVIDASDLVVFTSDETLELVMSLYPTSWRGKARVLPHSYDPQLYVASTPDASRDRLILRHLGKFYGERSPEPFLRACAELSRTQPELVSRFRVEFIGSIPERLLRRMGSLGLPPEFASFHEAVPYLEAIRLMQTADALLVLDAPHARNVFFPSKLADYLGTAKPILAITPPGTSARLVHAAGGWVIPPDRPPLMLEPLSSALSLLERGFELAPKQVEYRRRFAAPHVASMFREWLSSECP
jgi:Glycosyltransferase Family 4